MTAVVTAVSRDEKHRFSKRPKTSIRLVAGLGVLGDAHAGAMVKHRSRVREDPARPNLRQVHLIHAELHAELRQRGFAVRAGDMGENVTTSGVDLLALPEGTRLGLGERAVIAVTGLRNPCVQLDRFEPGLMAAVQELGPGGELVRKAGIMAVVLVGGDVRPGDEILVALPPTPHERLRCV